jgi:hypothetical protein
MTRRTLLLAPFALPLLGSAGDEAWALLASAASALAQGRVEAFLEAFDPAMQGFDRLRADVQALAAQFEPRSSVELESNEGDDNSRRIVADWTLVLVHRQNGISATRRKQRVTCTVERRSRRWRIVAFEPLSLFALS